MARRCLSPKIVSRVYRPPEIILLQNDYDTSVDIWSFGCILGELLGLTEPYLVEAENCGDRYGKELVRNRLLFPGECCEPLSPSFDVQKEDYQPATD